MKSNKYLTIGLLSGFIVGGCMGVLAWAFLQNLFAISICAGIGMLIGIVIGTLIDYEKNNHQEKYRKCRFGYRRRKFFVSGFTYLLRVTLRFCQTDKEKSSKSFSDLLLSLAADGRWIFSFESSGQVGPMMDSTINSCFPFKALCIFSISLDEYFFHNQSIYL